LLVGAIPAFATHVLYTVGAGPIPGLDLTPFAFTVTGITYGLALFHFDLLDRTPVAHRRAIELTGDGLLVVDTDGTIVDANDVARQLFDIDDREVPHVSSMTDGPELDGTTATGTIDGSQRVYDIQVTDLTDESGLQAGSSVILRDVTERDSYQQRLEVTNRVLRHNLRNDMNVIFGHAELLADAASTPDQRRLAETIQQTADELVTLSEKARELVQLSETPSHDSEAIALDTVLRSQVTKFRETYPEATVTVSIPDDLWVSALSDHALSVALWNLLENAAEHNDTDSLTVDISVTPDDRHAQVAISDDGSGLPETEQRVLAGEPETPLQHGSGLGLWITYWSITLSGGDIEVQTEDSEGTTVILSLSRPDSSSVDGTASSGVA
jgi:signal transduction histidine kinase